MQAPVVDNPAQSNQNIDMGITSTNSMGNGVSVNNSNNNKNKHKKHKNQNNLFGGIDTKRIVGAVAMIAFLMR
jgi:hypothetical protein